MYIYLENNFFIALNEIIAVLDYEYYTISESGKEYFEKNKKKIIDLSNEKKNSIIITEKYIYISSYTCRTIESRGNEYNNLKLKGRKKSEVNNGE